ncbi:unnamed protein product [Allacma fusca]|uniref:Uncharacterized protein n=1 Tax=Allacma fusca TaxID=39272 RepID=A0A8J2KRJ7_9HEXA|nr:unnamed protein product [Allacma fusca]
MIPKYVVRVNCYSWTQCYFKKCGPKDICRRGRYEESFEVPMRNYATRAQVADYLVEIENTDTESCQYTTEKAMAIIDGFYHHTGGRNANNPSIVSITEDVRMRGENIGDWQ